MFNTIETTWERSGRRGWSAAASFTMQAMGLSLLLLIPMFTTQGPPKLEWVRSLVAPAAPAAPAPPAPAIRRNSNVRTTNSEMLGEHIIQPPAIPHQIAIVNDAIAPPIPNTDGLGVIGGTGKRGEGIIGGTGTTTDAVTPPPPVQPRVIRISHWSEGNLVYRVQPAYPEIARSGRIQGAVILRAIISRNGLIENLTVEKGHPMLIAAAINAVKQWRYRPYLLNNEPVEVDTEITVNFILGGN